MTGHTPGPWADIKGYIVVRGGHTIASVNSYNSFEGRLNSRLIAAAPDMLDCLVSIRKSLIGSDVDIEHINKVIAKAEGNSCA